MSIAFNARLFALLLYFCILFCILLHILRQSKKLQSLFDLTLGSLAALPPSPATRRKSGEVGSCNARSGRPLGVSVPYGRTDLTYLCTNLPPPPSCLCPTLSACASRRTLKLCSPYSKLGFSVQVLQGSLQFQPAGKKVPHPSWLR